MRIAVAFCLFTVLCTVYASISPPNDLEILKLQIKNAISTVEDIIQKIEHVRIETEDDTLITVREIWWEQQDSHRDYVNLLLASMRREVNKAKLKGVDAQFCYDTNSKGISEQTSIAYGVGVKCKESAEISIKNNLGFLNSLISFGDTLIEDLNNVILNCHEEDTFKTNSCILTELGKINSVIRSFEGDTQYIHYSALSSSNYVVLQATKCLSNAYLLAHIDSQDAMMSNTRCVQKALEKKKKLLA